MLMFNFTKVHTDTLIVAGTFSLVAQVSELENHVCMQSFSESYKVISVLVANFPRGSQRYLTILKSHRSSLNIFRDQ